MGAKETPFQLSRHRISVDDFYRMAEVGILGPEQRVELIEGELIDMATIGTRHASAVRLLSQALRPAESTGFIVSVQNPVRLDRRSEPQPDVALLRPSPNSYASAHPTAADVLLLIEVSDTTLRYDTQIKLPLYARHGVPEVWVFDLEGHRLLRHRQPQGTVYAQVESITQPGMLVPDATPGLAIDLSGLPL